MTDMRVVAIIPALDEEAVIGGVVRSLPLAWIAHTIVVDNGSADRTAEVARAAGATVVAQPERGYGAACAAGYAAALAHGAAIILSLDGDGSDVTADIPAVLAPILAGEADFVVGSRVRGVIERGALLPQQRFGNWLVALLLRRHGLRVTDIGPLRAIRADAFATFDMQERTYGWSTEMLVKATRAGVRVREVPVSYRRRAGGQSKVAGTVRGSLKAAVVILGTTARYWRWSPAPAIPTPEAAR